MLCRGVVRVSVGVGVKEFEGLVMWGKCSVFFFFQAEDGIRDVRT